MSELHCSFCGKSQHAVAKLIAGPKVFICDECVGICITVLGADKAWCEKQLVEIERLRAQAPSAEATQTPS